MSIICHDGHLKDEFNNYYGIAHNDDTFVAIIQ